MGPANERTWTSWSRGDEMARRFNPPPNWPRPPKGFAPGPGWRPEPSWPPPPEGWRLWVGQPNWFVRHKLITAIAAIVLLLAAVFGGEDSPSSTQQRDDAASPPPQTTAPPPPITAAPTTTAPPTTAPHTPRPTPTRSPTATGRPSSVASVASVVDGDTLRLVDGRTVRLIGVDSPERGECGFGPASTLTKRLTLGKRVTLGTGARDDRDRYGRILRYVQVGSTDVGLALLRAGLATARYDSRDGYGSHPRELTYVRVDAATPQRACPVPKPTPRPTESGNCDPSYPGVCIPPAPPDLDCPDIAYRDFRVVGPDPHGFDGNDDNVGCET
ncbi:thermonuclease family protein [Kribbella sp. NPDC023972]|uniref:thermonuclease family protein n=1 Tax=Kribbella sp. NPDC023972 TaxID=3154795 RepID=UPI0033E64401